MQKLLTQSVVSGNRDRFDMTPISLSIFCSKQHHTLEKRMGIRDICMCLFKMWHLPLSGICNCRIEIIFMRPSFIIENKLYILFLDGIHGDCCVSDTVHGFLPNPTCLFLKDFKIFKINFVVSCSFSFSLERLPSVLEMFDQDMYSCSDLQWSFDQEKNMYMYFNTMYVHIIANLQLRSLFSEMGLIPAVVPPFDSS